MKRIGIAIPISLLLIPAFTVAQNNTSVAGKWEIHSSIAGSEFDTECTVVQTGTDLTGNCSSMGNDLKITGKMESTKISWQYDSQWNGSPLTMKYSGTLDSGKITGQVKVVQYGVDGDFTATIDTSNNAPNTAAATAPGVAATSPNQAQGTSLLSGKWNIHSSIAGSEFDTECTIVQTELDLTGNCTSMGNDFKIVGKVEGAKISWQYDSQYNGSPLTMKYSGTLDSGKITGQVTVAPYAVDGDFTAAREN